MMLNAYDFKVERLSDWAGLIRDNPEAEGIRKDYGTGRRITLLASSGPLHRVICLSVDMPPALRRRYHARQEPQLVAEASPSSSAMPSPA